VAEHDVVVIGGSAGALEPLSTVLKALSTDFTAAVLVVMHTSAEGSILPEILSRQTSMPVAYAINGEEIIRSRAYVAVPDRHLVIESGRVVVLDGPRENGFRPAIDPLFRSAANCYGPRVVGVILSGALDDGTFGLSAIKQGGGLAIVQHPYEASVPSMPLNAIQNSDVDHIVPAREIAQMLRNHAASPAARSSRLPPGAGSVNESREVMLNGQNPDVIAQKDGPPTYLSCPECGGTLWEIKEGSQIRFRCHTGHGFTTETLLHEQQNEFEHALWTAIRLLQERSALHRQLANRVEDRGMDAMAKKYDEMSIAEGQQSEVLREFFHRQFPGDPRPIQLQN